MAKILIVDDSSTVRKMLISVLEKSGHEIREAVDGKQALEAIKEEVPEICVCDVEMPDMDGYSLLRRVRSMEGALKEMPFLILTSKAKLRDMFHLEGATDFVEKSPEAFTTIQEKIENLLS